MLSDLFLPTFPHWKFGNDWSGSWGAVRFFVSTSGETMQIDVWDEDVCHELAQVKANETFSVTEEGLQEMRAWLETQIKALSDGFA